MMNDRAPRRRHRRHRGDFYTQDAITEADRAALLDAIKTHDPGQGIARVRAQLLAAFDTPVDLRTRLRLTDTLLRAFTAQHHIPPDSARITPDVIAAVLNDVAELMVPENRNQLEPTPFPPLDPPDRPDQLQPTPFPPPDPDHPDQP